MRVITGTVRGKRLESPIGRDVRPTTEKSKEAIFSAVQFEIEAAHVLDLYAGSGQLGVEALSRGAADCVFVDNSRDAIKVITKNIEITGLQSKARVVTGDSVQFASQSAEKYDIIFADPPYRHNEAERLFEALERALKPNGVAVIETEKAAKLPETVKSLTLKKRYCHGISAAWLYRKGE